MKTSILIVEDEGLIAFDLQQKLEDAGYTVPAIADNSEDALVGVERYLPSLVLMDIRLRGPRDGIETADLIRRRFHVPVMFVTAHSDVETLERARITEPFGYIVKPFQGVNFRAQIEVALWKHKMEEKLRISEAWLSATVRNVADALIATDSAGDIAFMNAPASDLTGWHWKEARGKPLLDVFRIFDEMTDLPVVNPLETIYDGRELATAPRAFKLLKLGGTEPVMVEAELSANLDEGTLLGIIVAFRDITERRKAEKRSVQLQKMNSLALMSIGLGREMAESHSKIDGALKELMSRSRGSTLRLLADVYESSGRQQAVIQKLITLGKTDSAKGVMVDLNEVLIGLEPTFRKSLGARRSLNLQLEPGISAVRMDLPDLRENLLRLVAEARNAMPDGGAVEMSTITTRSADGKHCVQLAIQDTGKGMRANAKERVFEPYYQSRAGNQNPGFSLALVYQFVALSGGTIEVQGAPGEGLAYLLSFPAADVSQMPPMPPDGERLAASA